MYNSKIKVPLVLLISILLTAPIFAQLDQEWIIRVPANDSSTPPFLSGNITHITSTGEFISSGYRIADDTTRKQIHLFKFNQSGEILWEYIYNSKYKIWEEFHDIEIDSEDNIIIAAQTSSFFKRDGNVDYETTHYLLLKISSSGDLLWEKEMPSEYDKLNYCADLVIDKEDNIYTTGLISQSGIYNAIINKIDKSGQTIWSNNIANSQGTNIELINDELVLSTISLEGFFSNTIYKYAMNGDQINSTTFAETGAPWTILDKKGNFYHPYNALEYSIKKYDPSLLKLWEYTKESNLPPGSCCSHIRDLYIDDIGNIYATGTYFGFQDTNNITNNRDILTVKLDSNGVVQWEDIYQFDNQPRRKTGYRIAVDSSGSTYVIGNQSGDMVILEYDQSGNRIDSTYYSGIDADWVISTNIFFYQNKIYAAGWEIKDQTYANQFVIQYTKSTTSIHSTKTSSPIRIYPNPTHGQPIILECDLDISSLTITDLLGRVVYQEQKPDCNTSISPGKALSKGCYILTIQAGDQSFSERILVN